MKPGGRAFTLHECKSDACRSRAFNYLFEASRPFTQYITCLACLSAVPDRETAGELLAFLQLRPEDYSKYMLLLFVLGLIYRLLAVIILAIRVRTCKPI
jgi:hypothetical protein